MLLAVAAPKEMLAVLAGVLGHHTATATEPELARRHWHRAEAGPRFDAVLTGVGKVNAAAAVVRALDPARHAGVLSLGVAGALPDPDHDQAHPARLGQAIAATACVYADEGLATPEGFVEIASLGFPLGPFPGSAVPVDAELLARLRTIADAEGPIATVSTCSGTAALTREVRRRTSASAEAMEGAAVAHVAARLGVACGELRVISNTTGDRSAQQWDLPRALTRLRDLAARL